MAGRIPQQFIDDLMSRVDIVEVIDSRVPLKKAGRDYTARCPFHEEKSPSFTVSPSKQFYHCFGCQAHGTVITFLMEYEHMDFVEAVRELASRAGMQIPTSGAEATPSRVTPDLYALMNQATDLYRHQLRTATQAVDYLKQRGLSGEIAAEFAIGYAPPGWDTVLRALGTDSALQQQLLEVGLLIEKDQGGYYDRFRDRIMFPIRDRRGRVIGFGGRVLGEGSPKYLNSPETPLFHKGQELYGLFEAQRALRQLDRILVVEGYMDVVALAQHGVRNAVATLGTATTAEHLERLFRTAPEVVFCFDGDRAGRTAAWRAAENALPLLRDGRQIRFMFLPEGDDPDTLIRRVGAEQFTRRIAQSVPFSSFFYEALSRRADISSMDGRARVVELAKPLLSKLPPGVYRHMMVDELAELAQIDASAIDRQRGTAPKSAARAAPGASKPQRGQPSPVRLAIALLLQSPELARHAGEPGRWEDLAVPGLRLLRELLELLQAQPHLSTGALLERWRDRDEGRHVAELARWHHPVPPEGVEHEFLGVIHWLDARLKERRRDHLDAKWQQEGLTDQEKQEYLALQRELAAGPSERASQEQAR